MSLLEVRSVYHSFAVDPVLSGVSFEAHSGQFVCLLGPSGSGKTTLLRIIAGLLKPSSGEVVISGISQAGIPTCNRDIGFVFQSSIALFPHLSVLENVAFPFKRGKRRSPNGPWRDAVHQILERVRLDVRADDSISDLSGGEKQRVALARALVYRPSLLLLDEPLSSLDNELKADLLTLIEQLYRETMTTFVYVTHDEREALRVATHIAVLDGGILQRFGEVSDVTIRPMKRRVAEIIGGWEILNAEIDQEGFPKLVLPSSVAVNIGPMSNVSGSHAVIALPRHRVGVSSGRPRSNQESVVLRGRVRSNRKVYQEQRIECVLEDGQVISCSVDSAHQFGEEDNVYVSFFKEDIHVLDS